MLTPKAITVAAAFALVAVTTGSVRAASVAAGVAGCGIAMSPVGLDSFFYLAAAAVYGLYARAPSRPAQWAVAGITLAAWAMRPIYGALFAAGAIPIMLGAGLGGWAERVRHALLYVGTIGILVVPAMPLGAPWEIFPARSSELKADAEAFLTRPSGFRPEDLGYPIVHVRWITTVDDATRRELEPQYGLAFPVYIGDATWRYLLRDSSPGILSALVNDSRVADTHGFDRQSYKTTLQPGTLPPLVGRRYAGAARTAYYGLILVLLGGALTSCLAGVGAWWFGAGSGHSIAAAGVVLLTSGDLYRALGEPSREAAAYASGDLLAALVVAAAWAIVGLKAGGSRQCPADRATSDGRRVVNAASASAQDVSPVPR